MAVVYWIHLEAHSDITKEGYVGITTQSPIERLWKHRHEAKRGRTILHRALLKYGENIIQTVLVEGSEEYCLMIENKLRHSPRIGWNTVPGGGKPPVHKQHTAEAKAKISAASTGRKASEETRAKMKIARNSRAPLSEESRRNMSIASSKRVRKPHSEETKLKMSLSKRMRDANKIKEKEIKDDYS
jgi:hypothetical protein